MNSQYSEIYLFVTLKKVKIKFNTKKVTNPVTITHNKSIFPTLYCTYVA